MSNIKIIAKNPCINIIYPLPDCIQKQTKTQSTMSDEELQKFKNVALSKYKNGKQKSRDWMVLLLMLNTGVRVGEMIALKWTDVDLENNTIHINKIKLGDNMKKFISWNVNGLRACVTKGFLDYFKEVDADILCIQELDEKCLPIGEPITPMEQNNIVPIKK